MSAGKAECEHQRTITLEKKPEWREGFILLSDRHRVVHLLSRHIHASLLSLLVDVRVNAFEVSPEQREVDAGDANRIDCREDESIDLPCLEGLGVASSR